MTEQQPTPPTTQRSGRHWSAADAVAEQPGHSSALPEITDDPLRTDTDARAGDDEQNGGPLMTHRPRIGLIGLHDLAAHLQVAGFEVVSGPDLKTAVHAVNEEVRKHGRFDVLMLNSPLVEPLVPRIYQHVNLTVIGTDQAPCGEPNGFATYQLATGSTVVDLLKNAGIGIDDSRVDLEKLPAGLQFDRAGVIIDPSQDDWSSWLSDPVSTRGNQTATTPRVDATRANPWLSMTLNGGQQNQPQPAPQPQAFDVDSFAKSLRGGGVRTGEAEVIVTVSGSGGTGKSTLSLALADRAANRGKNVILIGGNIGQPDLATYLRIADAPLPTMTNAIFAGKVEEGLVGAERMNQIRDAKLDKIKFAFLPEPTIEQLRSGVVTAPAVFELIDQARQIRGADLIVVDTQIIEADDPRRMVEDVILPVLDRGGWALAVTTLAKAGLANLINVMKRFREQGINPARVMSVLNRVPVDLPGVAARQEDVVAALRQLSVHRGTIWQDTEIVTRTNIGQPISNLPVTANILDGILNRIFDDMAVEAAAYDLFAQPERRPGLWSRLIGGGKPANGQTKQPPMSRRGAA
jgi:Mrp family chromosome partitioning ATPase